VAGVKGATVASVEQVLVPDIGDFDEVPVIEVLVAVGDTVAAEDPLVTLESDKATMDVPSPVAGKVAELKVSVGDKVSEGSALLTVEVDGGAPAQEAAPAPDVQESREKGEADAVDSAREAEASEDAGAADVAQATDSAPPRADSPPAAAPPAEAAAPGAPVSPQAGTAGAPVYASPGVRRLARELGVDLSAVRGTGRKGRITKEDVRRGPEAAAPEAAAPAVGGLELAPWPKLEFERFGEIERQPLTRIQRISGPNLARNWVMIPHVTHHDEADITDLEAFRKRTNAEQSDVKVTMVALLVKAVVGSLKAYPTVNSSLAGDELILKRYYNIGFAADTPNGLVVPVIKDADRKGILEIAAELTELSGNARAGKLASGDMQGSSFTISSLGGIGGTGFTPIVNAPEVAILGVTRSATKPVWDGSQFAPRLMLPLSLSYDHRVIDGALAARFVAHLVNQLSDLRRVLL
jgi:pyruvate dehydrogenase E2 component (dihydrolipoamide acetyltransferase)